MKIARSLASSTYHQRPTRYGHAFGTNDGRGRVQRNTNPSDRHATLNTKACPPSAASTLRGKCRLACRALWALVSQESGLAVVSQTAARYRMESLRRLRKQVPQKTQSQWRSSNIELYAPRSPNPTCARIRIQRIYFGAEYAREYAYSLRPSIGPPRSGYVTS